MTDATPLPSATGPGRDFTANWRPIAPPRVASVISDDLRRRIVEGDLPDGTLLPSVAELMGRYGASRPTVREAVRVLEAELLLAHTPGNRATFTVAGPSLPPVAKATAISLHLRGATVAAIRNVRADLERRLARWLTADGLAPLSRPTAGTGDFHLAVAHAAGNITGLTVLEILDQVAALGNNADLGPCADADAHAALRETAAAGDVDTFRTAWIEHVMTTAGGPATAYRMGQVRTEADQTEADTVAAMLRRRVVDGTLKPGDRLPIGAEMRDEHQLTRTGLREALRILEAEGLMHVQLGVRGGPVVAHPEPQASARYLGLLLQSRGTSIRDFMELRAIVESLIAGSLSESERPWDTLSAALAHEAAVLSDSAAFAPAGLRFHELLAARSPSVALGFVYELLEEVLNLTARARFSTEPSSLDRATEAHAEHVAMLKLLRDGEHDRASELWTAHCRLRPRPGDDARLNMFVLFRGRR